MYIARYTASTNNQNLVTSAMEIIL